VYSLEQMVGMKGAAFFAASMLACQNAPLDMLMYYDARVGCGMNGMFHTVTKKRLKGYYAPYAFADLYAMKNQVKVSSDDAQVYAVAAKGDNGKAAIMICYYSDDDNGGIRSITIKGLGSGELDCRMVDEDNTYSPAFPISRTDEEVTFVFQHNSFMLITLR